MVQSIQQTIPDISDLSFLAKDGVTKDYTKIYD